MFATSQTRSGLRHQYVRPISFRRFYSISDEGLKNLLESVKSGMLSPVEAADRITHTYKSKALYESVGKYAKIDIGRQHRTGFPEVVYAEGKSRAQLATILEQMIKSSAEIVMATRVNKTDALKLLQRPILQELEYHETARILSRKPMENASRRSHGIVSDWKRERFVCWDIRLGSSGRSSCYLGSASSFEIAGHHVRRLYDVGVAGIHRLFRNLDKLNDTCAAVCVAGMDGALPSVLGGLTSIPIIAVPTSVGYGAAFAGLAPLLTMLNSCSPGVSVVNIDNGFGAAVCADRILRLRNTQKKPQSAFE